MSSGNIYEDLQLTQRFMNLEWRLENAAPGIDMSSDSPVMSEMLGRLERAARTDAPILLRGEVGAGKTTLAWIAHDRSDRRDGPFIPVNCTALMEQITCGTRAGERVRATSLRAAADLLRARMDDASGGTLFLDEIDDIPSALVRPLLASVPGSTDSQPPRARARQANVRLLAATRYDGQDGVRVEELCQHLLGKMGTMELRVPALRERREDISRLALHFVHSLASAIQCPAPRLSIRATRLLRSHSWPGNIRELRNAIEHALISSPSSTIDVDAFHGRLPLTVRARYRQARQ